MTNKLQKLFSIVKNKAMLESYIEFDCAELLRDLKDRQEVRPLKEYLQLDG